MRVVPRPGALHLAGDGPGAVAGTVTARRFAGDHVLLTVRLDDADLDVAVPTTVTAAPQVGAAVTVAVAPDGLHVLS